ncbi:MAG: TonB-dependent receptor [Cytophagales bacterium]|nr:TonB-dependent receptor [Cytophagales bacterium]
MFKKILTLMFIGSIYWAQAQIPLKGRVVDENNNPLIGAAVFVSGTTHGTTTDVNGAFTLAIHHPDRDLVFSFIGYTNDTIAANNIPAIIQLAPAASELQEVVIKAETSFYDELDPIHNQVILESELLKAACCNLSESFETNASVDVSFSDAVSGSKQIMMLGLDGKYVQIQRENVPNVRGLTSRFGMGYIPGTWIQSIDVGKGAGSVVNGYESMTGQINLEFKKPEHSEKVYLNAYANAFGRSELNFNSAYDLNDKWSSAVLFHSDYFDNEIDRNDDGFLDLPKSRQINLMNRYKFQGEKLVSQIGVNVMVDQKAGGETGFGFGDDASTSSLYGFSNLTKKFEVFGKTGLLFPKTPYKGWGFIYSGTIQDMDSNFGRNDYSGRQETLYGNVIHQNIIGNSFHQYKTGVSFLYDRYQESYADSAFSRTEEVPGAYFEYSWLPTEDITLVAGARTDFHNLYGTYYTPRLHFRYQLNPVTTLRTSVGRGYRTPNVIAENTRVLISNRSIRVLEAIEPEVSWNAGGSIVTAVQLGERKIDVIADYFYTFFENQLVMDLDANSREVQFFNLANESFAHSLQFEASMRINEHWALKGAYKYYNVQSQFGGVQRQVPFTARNRFFVNASYATKFDKWTWDATLHWVGKKRLPNTQDKPAEFQKASFAPAYSLVNTQISRGFRWGSIYLGSENLLDFRQDDPIIDAENPFGEQFDGSLVWGPIAGRLVYAGFRYRIKRN